MKNIAIIGSSGAIGAALTHQLSTSYPEARICAISQSHAHDSNANNHAFNRIDLSIDYTDESTFEIAADHAASEAPLDMIIIATGILHNAHVFPEKSLKELNADNLQRVLYANTIVPALLMKHFLPRINTRSHAVCATLSARVGSISDNYLGGWYAYRASKSALNMMIKNAAIETARRNKNSIIVGVHPGTVDSNLSKPFQKNVAKEKLFSPSYSAKNLLQVLESLSPADTGKCFAWDGKEIQP